VISEGYSPRAADLDGVLQGHGSAQLHRHFAIASYQDQSKPPLNLFQFAGHEAGASTYSNRARTGHEVCQWMVCQPSAAICHRGFSRSEFCSV